MNEICSPIGHNLPTSVMRLPLATTGTPEDDAIFSGEPSAVARMNTPALTLNYH